MRRIVLITGCSTGIGRAAAQGLARNAHVVATARNLADIKELEGPHTDVLPLDVTKETSMQAAVQAVVRQHGRIDALVNNAGYGVMLPMEDLPLEAMRRMYDVNVFGMHRLTQLVLPIMRQQGHGRIVNISSAAGHISLPLMGAYCGTKFAVRAHTWALDNEVRQFGIRACLVEPGRIRTDFGKRSAKERKAWGSDAEAGAYAGLMARWDDVRYNGRGQSVDIITRRIRHACLARRPRFHYLAPLDAKGANWATRLLPDTLLSKGLRAYFRLASRGPRQNG